MKFSRVFTSFSANLFARPVTTNNLPRPRENFHENGRTPGVCHFFNAQNYDLAATLTSGQTFRWYATADTAWEGVIGRDHILLRQHESGIEAQPLSPNPHWNSIQHYLQTDIDIDAITATFP